MYGNIYTTVRSELHGHAGTLTMSECSIFILNV